MLRVAVIGGGLSGTLAAMRIVELAGERVRVTLVERKARQLQRGVAYSARLSQQLLNVPAGRMSLFPERPDDFLDWLRAGPMPQVHADELVPRNLFGDHASDRFHSCLDENRGCIKVVHGEAIGLDQHPANGYRVKLDDERSFLADVVVLALGNAPPAHVPGLDPAARKHPAYIAWPWAEDALRNIGPGDEVVFVGAGLTMVDVLLSLEDAGHQGPVTLISRNGRTPLPHHLGHHWTLQQALPTAPHAAADLLRWVRNEVALAEAKEIPWQTVMDAVKPLVQDWWMGMEHAERERFLRHLRPFWEVHRHRMPRRVHKRLQACIDSGRVRSLAARIGRMTVDDDRLRITYRERGSAVPGEVWAKHIINCTGPQSDTRRMDQPLIVDMLAMGHLSWDPLRMGIRTDPSGALIDASGRVSESLFAIGPLRKPTLWESTAVPEIRIQALELARHLAMQRKALGVKGWRKVLRSLADRLALVEA